jgi:hypothetical protein
VRVPLLVAVGVSALVAGGLGQERAELQVVLRGNGAPTVDVSLQGLLADNRILDAMESGFPLYVEFHVELRQSRSLWDRTVARQEWEFVVLYDPVRDRYVLEEAEGTEYIPTQRLLEDRLQDVYAVRMRPDRNGEFHFHAAVDARTLSDDDVDEVFAWLKGEDIDSLPVERPGWVTRTARRLLIQVAPLPRVHLEGRTADFPSQRP